MRVCASILEPMSQRGRILSEALKLPAEDRAAVAGALLRSLDAECEEDAQTVESAWAEEICQRLRRLDAGEEETLSGPEARRFITADVDDR